MPKGKAQQQAAAKDKGDDVKDINAVLARMEECSGDAFRQLMACKVLECDIFSMA